jgi:thiol-disulfide isomerase/thioredoxin
VGKMIAFWGINCADCPTFLATRDDDENKRKEVAEQWSKDYRRQIKPEDINCDGCLLEEGRLFTHCGVCEIRKCGQEKKIKNCAYCNEYSCQNFKKFFVLVPYGKANLKEIKNKL